MTKVVADAILDTVPRGSNDKRHDSYIFSVPNIHCKKLIKKMCCSGTPT